ncbi:MAG TPA: hypothetical protein PLI62_12335 [Spirochaetota bacterium]|nr:hypothetical protein [Spirochaetota bacterium]
MSNNEVGNSNNIVSVENNTSPEDTGTSFARKLLTSGVIRFAGWWSIFAGALALNSVCPICGGVACPVGLGTTGIIAGLLAGIKQWGGRSIKFFTGIFRPGKSTECATETAHCTCTTCSSHNHHHGPEHHASNGEHVRIPHSVL